MKNRILLLVYITIATISCKKDELVSRTAASITVVNALNIAPNLAINFSATRIPYSENRALIGYGSSLEFGNPPGKSPFVLVASSDTSQIIYSGTLNTNIGGLYSLYVSGDQSSNPDVLILKDTIPYTNNAVAFVRFINLSKGSNPISVNLQGNFPTQNEFQNIGYQKITPFKSYDSSSNLNGSYNFEIRDQSTGNLLTTFSWNYTGTKSNTVVIYGSEDPSSSYPLSAFQVNNY